MEASKQIPPFSKIGEILVAEGVITEEQLHKSLNEQQYTQERLGHILIKLGYAIEENVYSALAKQSNLPFLSNEQLLEAPEDVVKIIPEAFARENTLIAHSLDNGALLVAMEDPEDIIAIDNLQKLTDQKVVSALATPSGIKAAIEQLYVRIRKAGEVSDVIGSLQIFAESEDEEEGLVDMTKSTEGVDDAPVVKLVNLIIADALKERATDIHVEMQREYVSVRYLSLIHI